MLCPNDQERRAILTRSVELPFTYQDVAAMLLGDNLWYRPLQEYRNYLESLTSRPHLWDFVFEDSRTWNDKRWQSLTLAARVARTRIGSLVHASTFVFAPSAVGLPGTKLKRALAELSANGLCRALPSGSYQLEPVAPVDQIRGDLHLAEIIAHWLLMLAHADLVAKDRSPSGYEVSGYAEACPACRSAWGIRPRTNQWIPPFHPGCRCFAQPRFASGSSSRQI
jgi:hypothetical protein